MEPKYLGDGLYVQYDGECVILSTGSHHISEQGQVVYLNDEVLPVFLDYIESLKQFRARSVR